MANIQARERAKKLRQEGKSLNEISSSLHVPKSTIRYWCRDIVLSYAKLQALFERQKMGGILAAEKIRKERIDLTQRLYKEGIKEIAGLSRRERLLIGTALYWAEGYRKGDGEFGFTNSDPHMIQFMIRWLQEVCKVDKQKIRLRVCINAMHKKRLNVIHKFWAKTIGLPLAQFSKPTLIQIKSQKVYTNQETYFGTLRVKVKQSTNMKRKIMGWIGGIIHAL